MSIPLILCAPFAASLAAPISHAGNDAIQAALPRSDEQNNDPRVTALINKANQRVAQGESPDVVERWLTGAVETLGIEKTPPSWDVFGQARWKKLAENAR
ncbi:hypothetical protein [Dyella sp. GSA-30]|uniref:hypothetical protein n=1 Tax=Dyella sp. GSA-30 TaxID=2994496 RepID=UPI0024905DFB|nr:hypothetical protein [Dyella sp. GSA-30]